MYLINMYMSIYLLMISCFLFSISFKHLLMTIMSLEFMMVSIFFNFYMILMMLKVSLYLIFVFLTMTVCEGALGVTLIIMMVRFYGNDYSNSLILLKW